MFLFYYLLLILLIFEELKIDIIVRPECIANRGDLLRVGQYDENCDNETPSGNVSLYRLADIAFGNTARLHIVLAIVCNFY